MTDQLLHMCRNLEDLNGLEELYQLLFGEYAPRLGWKKPVSKKLLYYVQKNRNSLYTEFHIQKKSKALRTISAPKAPLKRVQKLTAELLTELVPKHPSAHGFLPGRSITGNASAHTAQPFVLNIDLENFFPSIPAGRIYGVLTKGSLKFSPKLAYYITHICTRNGALPQGSPASPILSNLVCWYLDNRLRGLAEQYDVIYSRYADDLTFSSERPFPEAFLVKLDEIIKAENFSVNHKKVRLQKADVCQEVTGLVVNEKVNLRREYIREIRAMLHNWETLGYEEAQQKFLENYFPKKAKGKSELKNVLAGKLQFFRMVRGKEDREYQRYFSQYKRLSEGNFTPRKKQEDLMEFPVLHEPRKVVAFLRQFRTVNDSGFRELLHDPDTADFDFLANMEKVNKAMPEVKEILTPSIYRKLKSFVDVYNKYGIPYFKETRCLPLKGKNVVKATMRGFPVFIGLGNSTFPCNEVKHQAFVFRSQIRIGNDFFQDLILLNSLKPVIKQLTANGTVDISYDQGDEEFSSNCTFFTDSWQVRNTIVILLHDLANNPAYAPEGSKRSIFLRSATVQPNPQKKMFCTNIYLRLEEGNADMAELQKNSAVQKAAALLKNLGDWSVLVGQEGKTEQHFLLQSPDSVAHQLPFLEGLTFKLTFFQS